MSKYAYILLIKEKWWNRRVTQSRAGKKIQVFVRKNAVGPINTKLLLFYVNHPVQEIRGTGDFKERVVGKIEALWRDYNEEMVFKSHNEYLNFMKKRTKATLIRFTNLHELHPPVPLQRTLQIIGASQLARSGKYLSRESVNKLLGGCS